MVTYDNKLHIDDESNIAFIHIILITTAILILEMTFYMQTQFAIHKKYRFFQNY